MTTAETDAQHEAEEAEYEQMYQEAHADTHRPRRSQYLLLAALTLLMLSLAFAAEKRAPFLPQPFIHSLVIQKGH